MTVLREFINTYAGRPKEEVFNMAINTTLSRTLITSGTIFLVVGLLFVFGGGAIKGFAFGMLVGIFFGTYSSIFIASALVVDFMKEDVIQGKQSSQLNLLLLKLRQKNLQRLKKRKHKSFRFIKKPRSSKTKSGAFFF